MVICVTLGCGIHDLPQTNNLILFLKVRLSAMQLTQVIYNLQKLFINCKPLSALNLFKFNPFGFHAPKNIFQFKPFGFLDPKNLFQFNPFGFHAPKN